MRSHEMRQKLLEKLGIDNEAFKVIRCIKTSATPRATIEHYSGVPVNRVSAILNKLTAKRLLVHDISTDKYRHATLLRVSMFQVAQEMKNS